MAKRATTGRPRKVEAPKPADDAGVKQENVNQEFPSVDGANEAEQLVPKEDKIVEVTTKTKAKPKKLTPAQLNRKLHTVIVKGREREMTRFAYEAIAKDPSLDVKLPKGSTLTEPNLQPCVDC